MELIDALTGEGVDTLDALKEKIRAEEKVKSDLVLGEKDTEITNLETIKKESIEKLAEAGRTIVALTPPPISKEKETENEQAAAAEAEASLNQVNKTRSKSLSEEDDVKLVEAYKGLPPETQKLVDASAEGLSSFMDEVLGSDEQPLQKTFRQPVEQVKQSISELIQIGLGKLKPQTTPRMRPQGLAISSATRTPQSSGPAIRLGHDADLLSAIKRKQ